MPYYYKIQDEVKLASSYETVSALVLEHAKSSEGADAFYLYHPVGSEPQELETALEHGLERIKAGHPAHIIATNSNKTLWEVTIWTPECE
jgi:hypothetical protein